MIAGWFIADGMVLHDGKEIGYVTPTQEAILNLLWDDPGHYLPVGKIAAQLYVSNTEIVTMIYKIRKRLGPRIISTRHRRGYMFTGDVSA